MKFFYSPKDVMEMGMKNLTEADLDQMEANGQDVSELRKKLAERNAELERAGETDLSKLDAYASTPRSRDTEFFKINAGKAPLLGKAKFYEKYENAKIVFPVVVQAASSLYVPGDDASAAVIVLHGLSEQYKNDFEALRKAADLLVAMRDGEVEVPKSLKKLVKDLNNPKSHIHTELNGEDVDASFAGAKFLVDTVYSAQSELPNKRIPNDRVLAMLNVYEKADHNYYQLIKGQFYTK